MGGVIARGDGIGIVLPKRLPLPWLRRRPTPAPAPAEPTPEPEFRPAPPLRRLPAGLRHEWLTVAVARSTLQGPVPLANARVAVRPWSSDAQGAAAEPIARAMTGPDGSASFHLPAGRYAIAASHGQDAKAVTLALDRTGRATLLLDGPGRLVALAVDVRDPAGHPLVGVPVEALDALGLAAGRALTDEHGHAVLALPPGHYQVRALAATATVALPGTARLRLVTAPPPPAERQEAAAQARSFEPPLDGPWN